MTVDELHFDFLKSATRKAFFGQAVAAMTKADKPKVAAVINDTSIPDQAQLSHLDEVFRAIDTTVASDVAKTEAKQVYQILAEAEAEVHGCSVEETHFHEVGLGMTCREIIGICTAISCIRPQRITATPVQVGSGKVECAHGVLDIPAPATAAILEKYEIPIAADRLDGELCTPTSAALIAHFVGGFHE